MPKESPMQLLVSSKRILFVLVGLTFAFQLFAQDYRVCEYGLKAPVELVMPRNSFSQCDYSPWILVFDDEFDGNSLDMSKWNYGPRTRYSNNEQQYYTHGENIEVSDGTLKLIAKRDTLYARAADWFDDDEELYADGKYRGRNLRFFYYTSADIETKDKFAYGKYEARIKIPKGKGFWPAFWLFGAEPVYNEIDIFEFWNEYSNNEFLPDKLSKVDYMTVHYDHDDDGIITRCGSHYEDVDLSEDFHIYTLIWEKYRIEWYVDGKLKWTVCRYYNKDGRATDCFIDAMHEYLLNGLFPQDPMNIILNFAIQDGINSPDSITVFPSQMEVDWVRYYQR